MSYCSQGITKVKIIKMDSTHTLFEVGLASMCLLILQVTQSVNLLDFKMVQDLGIIGILAGGLYYMHSQYKKEKILHQTHLDNTREKDEKLYNQSIEQYKSANEDLKKELVAKQLEIEKLLAIIVDRNAHNK